ncbi:hypothetical protein [Leptolyngbya sp. AN10]|uniref:hypothetical protein n=1 Tax=Leptolyngbya sp. AN10 TaxID=3423365 RepID=UPI003D312F45
MLDLHQYLKTAKISSISYSQLKQLWKNLNYTNVSYFNHNAQIALALANQYGLSEAHRWIESNPNDYEWGVETGQWTLIDGWKNGKFNAQTDIIAKRWNEGANANALTNVPRFCILHSTCGHEWGYSGSGPSDFALDILNWYLPGKVAKRDTVDCLVGTSRRSAWQLHGLLREWLNEKLDRSGGTIPAQEVHNWIRNHHNQVLVQQR